MADELSNYLMNGSRHASLSAESLELMGKQAANRFLNEGIALNESIAKLAAVHEDISGEQVKRVAEFANNAVYLAKHDQSKTAGAETSYPQFELADPSRIIQNMSEGSRPTISTPVDIEYSKMPSRTKTASVHQVEDRDVVLERIFGVSPEKADLSYSKDTVTDKVIGAKSDLVALKENLESHGEQFTMALKEAQAEYYGLVKNHLLEGGSLSDVIVAAQSTGADKMKIAEAFRPVIERLLKEKIATPRYLTMMTEQLEKVAHRVVNEKHPLVSTFASLIALETEIDKVAMSLSEVDDQLGRVKGFIKEHFLARSAR